MDGQCKYRWGKGLKKAMNHHSIVQANLPAVQLNRVPSLR
jgi:hypothetical protein